MAVDDRSVVRAVEIYGTSESIDDVENFIAEPTGVFVEAAGADAHIANGIYGASACFHTVCVGISAAHGKSVDNGMVDNTC